jgi:hypothetical protein
MRWAIIIVIDAYVYNGGANVHHLAYVVAPKQRSGRSPPSALDAHDRASSQTPVPEHARALLLSEDAQISSAHAAASSNAIQEP